MTEPVLSAVARHSLDALGGTPNVVRYHRSAGDEWVDVLDCVDRPATGQTSWATIGMSLFDLELHLDEVPIRLEIAGLAASGIREFSNMLSAAAFNIATGEYTIEPGTIHPDIVNDYLPNVSTKHLMFVPVFSWSGLENLEVEGMLVSWLQAVPVTHAEFAFARSRDSSDELQDLLADADADIADLDRVSVV